MNKTMIRVDLLPKVSDKRIALNVTPAAERALRGGHPWLFDRAIRKQSHEGQAGDLAVIFDSKRRFIAVGLYDPDSPIRVKVLQHGQPATIDHDWFLGRLQSAAAIRQPLPTQSTNGYRLVHGENDSLPGLVIDRYADTLVMKLYSAAWLPHLGMILDCLPDVQSHERLVLRISRKIQPTLAPYGLYDGQTIHGEIPQEAVIFQENGLSFAADVISGHKTGFFFDQRDNRAKVRELAAGKRVLDVFAYSGGFSVYAAAGGATSVLSLDASAPALESAVANFALNEAEVSHTQHKTMVADAFEGLAQLHATGEMFDLVIVDPPAFAKSEAEIKRALTAYKRLTHLALPLVTSGGQLVMASCSSRVSADDFFQTIERTASASGRTLTDIQHTGHALDHPITYPEGAYLKCLFARIDVS